VFDRCHVCIFKNQRGNVVETLWYSYCNTLNRSLSVITIYIATHYLWLLFLQDICHYISYRLYRLHSSCTLSVAATAEVSASKLLTTAVRLQQVIISAFIPISSEPDYSQIVCNYCTIILIIIVFLHLQTNSSRCLKKDV